MKYKIVRITFNRIDCQYILRGLIIRYTSVRPGTAFILSLEGSGRCLVTAISTITSAARSIGTQFMSSKEELSELGRAPIYAELITKLGNHTAGFHASNPWATPANCPTRATEQLTDNLRDACYRSNLERYLLSVSIGIKSRFHFDSQY